MSSTTDLIGVVDSDGNRIRPNMSVYADGVVWNVRHALPSMIVLNRTKDDGKTMTMLLGRRYWKLISVQGWYAGDWPNASALATASAEHGKHEG